MQDHDVLVPKTNNKISSFSLFISREFHGCHIGQYTIDDIGHFEQLNILALLLGQSKGGKQK